MYATNRQLAWVSQGLRGLALGYLFWLAGCGLKSYETRMQATVDDLTAKRIEAIQKQAESAGQPAAAPAANAVPVNANTQEVLDRIRKSRASVPRPNPGGGGGVPPVGQTIVAPLD